MDTKNLTREQISTLVDNELTDGHLDVVLAALRGDDGRAAWDIYHQIGDLLRSDEVDHTFSRGFAERFAARLDAEPVVVAPQAKPQAPEVNVVAVAGTRRGSLGFRRFALPAAAAAVAAAAFIASPQLMVAFKGGNGSQVASSSVKDDAHPVVNAGSQNMGELAAIPNGTLLRDPRIDQYLMAHQRFSPSLYSTAQYARSASFASDADK